MRVFVFAVLFCFSSSSIIFAYELSDDDKKARDACGVESKPTLDSCLTLAKKGNALAQGLVGIIYFDGKVISEDYEEAYNWFKLSAEQGHISGHFGLSQMYLLGKGAPQDYNKAFHWLKLPAEIGFPEARSQIYDLAKKKVPPALQFLKNDANNGILKAQFNLGEVYMDGLGVIEDYHKAYKWFITSAKQGYSESKLKIYRLGRWGFQKGLEYLKTDAEKGFVEAQNELGEMRLYGRGIPQNYIQAHMWFNLAGAQGNRDARSHLEIVERKMSPEQIEKAQEMARDWKPNKSKNAWDILKEKVGAN